MEKNVSRNNLFKACTLAIKTGSSALVKTTAAACGKIDGEYTTIAAQDMPALTGHDVADDYSRVLAFYTDGTTETIVAGDAFLTSADNMLDKYWPGEVEGKMLLGWVLIANATDAIFDAGTTALDAENLTVTYFDNFGVVGNL